MLDPNKVKVGDRLKWRLSEGGFKDFAVEDGHGATVILKPYQQLAIDDEWLVYVEWDPGTTQNDGGYSLKDFVRWDTEMVQVDEAILDYEPCRCKEPDLVRNIVAGKEFLFCRVCKKERPILTF